MTAPYVSLTPHVRVVAAVLRWNGKVHVQQRRAGDKRGGLWEFAGGKQERGETDETTLERELLEELGIVATIGVKVAETFHAYPECTCNVALYFVEGWQGTPVARAADRESWVRRDEFEEMLRQGNFVPSMTPLYAANPHYW